MPTLSLGNWRATPIETGRLRLDGGSMFGSVPKAIWNKAHPADDRNRIQLAMRCSVARRADGSNALRNGSPAAATRADSAANARRRSGERLVGGTL